MLTTPSQLLTLAWPGYHPLTGFSFKISLTPHLYLYSFLQLPPRSAAQIVVKINFNGVSQKL